MTTHTKQSRYLEGGYGHCPNCLSDEIEGGGITVSDNLAHQEVGCNECNAEWVDEYRLSRISDATGFDPDELTAPANIENPGTILLRVTAMPTVQRSVLSEEDQAVPVATTVELRDSVEPRYWANAALDVFHSSVAVDDLESFAFTVHQLNDDNGKPAHSIITEDPNEQGLNFSDQGTIT